MKHAKHTPGPWHVERLGSTRSIEFAEGTKVVTNGEHIHALTIGGTQTQAANAQLIAAAPELLETLADLLTNLEGYAGTSLHESTHVHMVFASRLLAKARGES